MVEIFDENWFDKVDVSRVKVRQSSVKIPKRFAVLCSHFLVIFWNVLNSKPLFTLRSASLGGHSLNSFYLSPHSPNVTNVWQGLGTDNSLRFEIVESRSSIPNQFVWKLLPGSENKSCVCLTSRENTRLKLSILPVRIEATGRPLYAAEIDGLNNNNNNKKWARVKTTFPRVPAVHFSSVRVSIYNDWVWQFYVPLVD